MNRAILVIALCLTAAAAAAEDLQFTLHKLDSGRPGPTLLVVGGIQGDEPGGFNAASLLVTHYRIRTGRVWVVPNLNFISIIHCSRGIHGDLNRKFAELSADDPEYGAIQKIKAILLDDPVDMILNLHDGSGFYRERHIDGLHNPLRWGQSIIIDQERMDGVHPGAPGELGRIARTVVGEINQAVLDDEHVYRVKNTRTREGDLEMARTLTYFAVCNGKPAFGLEASKSFPAHVRTFYHLRALESFMGILGIEFQRRFPLALPAVQEAIDDNVQFALYQRRIFLDVANARQRLNYVPMKKDAPIDFSPSNPLIALVPAGKHFRVFHGNRPVTRLHPQYFDYDTTLQSITMHVDGKPQTVFFGDVIRVSKTFQVAPLSDYRVNVIGFRGGKGDSEAGVPIALGDIEERFSVDTTGSLFRVEVYRGERFSGMILVQFDESPEAVHLARVEKGTNRKDPTGAGTVDGRGEDRPKKGR
jgi:hypothetical protein